MGEADSSHMAQGLLVNLLDKRESRKCGSQAVFVVASEEWFIPLSKLGGKSWECQGLVRRGSALDPESGERAVDHCSINQPPAARRAFFR